MADNRNGDIPFTRKEILKMTEEELERGKSKQQVLDDLSQRQQHYNQEYLAQIISQVPNVELRRKYSTLNRVFFGLLVFTAGLSLAGAILALSRRNAVAAGDAIFGLFIFLCFAAPVRRMQGGIYRPLGLLLLGVTGILGGRLSAFLPWSLLIVLLVGATSILSFYLGSCLFPHHGFIGIKKDQDGKWML